MTKAEITEESNRQKAELNTCTRRVENCGQAIKTFGLLRDYYKRKTTEVKIKKVVSFAGFILALISMIATYFISLPACFVASSIFLFSINRFYFFKDVEKKFERCHTLFNNIVQHLTDKKLSYSAKIELIMQEIIKLENMLPDSKIVTQTNTSTVTAGPIFVQAEESDITSL